MLHIFKDTLSSQSFGCYIICCFCLADPFSAFWHWKRGVESCDVC